MNSYDRWKTTPPWDTEENARLSDALHDAGWCDKKLYHRINEMIKVGRIMTWLSKGIYEDDPCIDFYDWLCQGIGIEAEALESEIIEDVECRINYDIPWFNLEMEDISAIGEIRSEMPDDVLQYFT